MNPQATLQQPWPRHWRARRGGLAGGVAALAVALCVPRVHALLEGSMTLQMLVVLPGLFCAGCALPWLQPDAWRERITATLRPYELSLLAFAMLAYGAWMLPVALDLSRLEFPTLVAKYALVVAAGVAAHFGFKVSAWPLVLFFGGNYIWMGLTFGMLFIDSEARLCASYLLADQRIAGVGLVIYSGLLGIWLLAWAARKADAADRPNGPDVP
ncbi:hypothetical protein [Cupriavidus sp. UME77]|uniref:hypothetical protein n=1 Tax=Cupriavidus sp. UME77 TaxID=1862321 RepID=UPI0016027847|nr:hypothetical protein [Cupriavidus sp. UME77]